MPMLLRLGQAFVDEGHELVGLNEAFRHSIARRRFRRLDLGEGALRRDPRGHLRPHVHQHRTIGDELGARSDRAVAGDDPGRFVRPGDALVDRRDQAVDRNARAQIDEGQRDLWKKVSPMWRTLAFCQWTSNRRR